MVDTWKKRLPEICSGFSKEDIWNMDESEVFWQALPDIGFGQKSRQCHGGKQSIRRFVSADGKKQLKADCYLEI